MMTATPFDEAPTCPRCLRGKVREEYKDAHPTGRLVCTDADLVSVGLGCIAGPLEASTLLYCLSRKIMNGPNVGDLRRMSEDEDTVKALQRLLDAQAVHIRRAVRYPR
jgi:hypothetical protein